MTTPEISLAAALAGAAFIESLLKLPPEALDIVARRAAHALCHDPRMAPLEEERARTAVIVAASAYLSERERDAAAAAAQPSSLAKEPHDEAQR